MTITANDLLTDTNNNITVINQRKLSDEVSLTERYMKIASNKGLTHLIYNANIIGNPINNDIMNDSTLTDLQILYRNNFINVGYKVNFDSSSGYWKIDWSSVGAETSVKVYSMRTILTPGAMENITKTVLGNYLNSIIPNLTYTINLVNIGSGSDTDETQFGATSSSYYEYLIITQQVNNIDYSSNIENHLISQNIGYNSNNFQIYKLN